MDETRVKDFETLLQENSAKADHVVGRSNARSTVKKATNHFGDLFFSSWAVLLSHITLLFDSNLSLQKKFFPRKTSLASTSTCHQNEAFDVHW